MKKYIILCLTVFCTLLFFGCSSNSKSYGTRCPTFDGSRVHPEKDLRRYANHRKALKRSGRSYGWSGTGRKKSHKKQPKMKVTLREY